MGFGNDPDAWRIANSAVVLRDCHVYRPSRLNYGYDLNDYGAIQLIFDR